MRDVLTAFGPGALLAGLLYAAAIVALMEAIKRGLARRLGRKLTPFEIALTVAALGALTGPAVWPWVWVLISPDTTPPPPFVSAVLGVGTSGVAHILYPVALERVLGKIGGKRADG